MSCQQDRLRPRRVEFKPHLVLLYRCIMNHPDVVVDVKVEERTRLAARLVDNEVVKGVVLWAGERVTRASVSDQLPRKTSGHRKRSNTWSARN